MTHVRSRLIYCFLLVFALLQTGVQGQTWTQPETAKKENSDFLMQGEYRGKLNVNGQERTVGAQVIARGDGQFQLVVYPGGLPGKGWNGENRFRMTSERNQNQVRFEAGDELPFATALLQKQRIKLINDNGQGIGQLKKGQRTSPTLGQNPPENAVVLFDGTNETLESRWQDGANMTDDGLLTEGATSTYTFQDALIHLEFRLPFKPNANGQARGNSGCYVQGRYEVQLLDSFGLAEKNNRCGGIYGVRPPDINMCYPPLSWQTYDIKFQAPEYNNGKKTSPARLTVRHNGVLIHENVKVKKATRAAPVKEGPEPGPLYLQDHGNPVRFRNTWVVPLNQ